MVVLVAMQTVLVSVGSAMAPASTSGVIVTCCETGFVLRDIAFGSGFRVLGFGDLSLARVQGLRYVAYGMWLMVEHV